MFKKEVIEAMRKSDKFKKTNDIWQKHCTIKKIGSAMAIARRCGTKREFIKRFDIEAKKDLHTIAEEFYKDLLTYGDISFDEAYLMTYIRIIEQTWEGKIWEKKTLEWLNVTFPDIQFIFGSQEDDCDYSVDAIAYKNFCKQYGIQIKPISYKNMDDNDKRKKLNKTKNSKFTEKFNIPIYYAYYDRYTEEFTFDKEA